MNLRTIPFSEHSFTTSSQAYCTHLSRCTVFPSVYLITPIKQRLSVPAEISLDFLITTTALALIWQEHY